jgi:hypothetical protein
MANVVDGGAWSMEIPRTVPTSDWLPFVLFAMKVSDTLL